MDLEEAFSFVVLESESESSELVNMKGNLYPPQTLLLTITITLQLVSAQLWKTELLQLSSWTNKLMQSHIVAQKLVDELVLLRHLHQAISLFSHPAHGAKNWHLRRHSRVPLRPKLNNIVSETYSRACATNTSWAVNYYFLLVFRSQNHQDKVFKHKLEWCHWVTRRYAMIWPSCIVDLLY